MDRPEWVSASPITTEVCCCLTNNKNRGRKANAGEDFHGINGPNPRRNNIYGQIVRWFPFDEDHTSDKFKWDLFVLAGNPLVHSDLRAGSKNINENNIFNSPDGLCFDSNGFLWIQTDGKYNNKGNYRGMGNNQMLLGNPQTGEIKRFMVGPRECEVTGITWSEDRKTLFVGIQHPGERGNSSFPGGRDTLSRSSIISIQRNDHSIIG
jgi:secreted PhoX family phosphatase